ncbi:MAG: 4Fe-4S binding protein [Clostridiales bacterium]|nr:4Fe-4S binding protein [Clostridiales bacterium]
MLKPKWNKEYKPPASWEEMPFTGNVAGLLPTPNSGFRTLTPHFNLESCIKCMLCWVYCPEGCIDKSNETFELDRDYCKGCGICAHECPKKCIEMVRE